MDQRIASIRGTGASKLRTSFRKLQSPHSEEHWFDITSGAYPCVVQFDDDSQFPRRSFGVYQSTDGSRFGRPRSCSSLTILHVSSGNFESCCMDTR